MLENDYLHKQPCEIVAEVAQAHDGSLGMAHAYIDAISEAGASAVKFQTHIAAAESTPDEPWRVKFSRQDASRYDYWKRMEFTEEQWHGLKKHAADSGLKFLSSPFSVEAVDLLTRVGVDAWKVASGEINNAPMFDRMAAHRVPIVLSTGISSLSDIDAAVDRVKSRRLPLTVLQCTSAYPCPPEKIGLNLIPFFRKRYDCEVGLSDHSGTIFAGLAAATIGIEMVEVHVTFDRKMFGPDVPASVTITELAEMVRGIRFIETIRANPVDKDAAASEMAPMRRVFTKSVVACVDLPAGTVLKMDHLRLKKPGTGIPAEQIDRVIGRRLRRDVKADELIGNNDFEPVDDILSKGATW